MTVCFVVIYAEDLFAVRKFALSPLAGSSYFFDIYPFPASRHMALLRLVHLSQIHLFIVLRLDYVYIDCARAFRVVLDFKLNLCLFFEV